MGGNVSNASGSGGNTVIRQHSNKVDGKTTCCDRPLVSALNERTGQVGWYCKGCGGYVATVPQCHASTPIPLPSVTSSADDPVNSCKDKI